MSIDEAARHRLYGKLESVLGSEDAETLMEHLPPTGWGDVARRHDVEASQVLLSKDIESHRLAVSKDIESHRLAVSKDIEALRVATTRDLASLRTDLSKDIESQGHQLRAEMERMGRRIIMWNTTAMLAGLGLAFGIGRLT